MQENAEIMHTCVVDEGEVKDFFHEILTVHCNRKNIKHPLSSSLSRRTGISENAIRKWLNGDSLPSLVFYYKLVQFFGEQFRVDIEAEMGISSMQRLEENNWFCLGGLLSETSGLLFAAADPTRKNANKASNIVFQLYEKIVQLQPRLDGYKNFLKSRIEFKKEIKA